MGLSKKTMMMMMMKMSLVLFLMAFTVTVVEARFDANIMLAEMFKDNGEPNYFIKSTTTACCNNCRCTKSMPPQCHCSDIAETCHSACKLCICAYSYPPQCRCVDTNNFCYPPCSSSAKPQNIAAN